MKIFKCLICSLTLAALVAICLAGIPTFRLNAAAASESDLTFKLNSTKDGYIVSACATTASGALVIPATYNGLPVKEIAAYAFRDCAKLTSVTVPDSVETMGYGVFRGCGNLEALTIPFVGDQPSTQATTTKRPLGYIFGGYSYAGGVSTQQAEFSSGYSLHWSFYYIPESLKSVTVTGPDDLRGAFSGCSNLTSVTILANPTAIEEYAFYHCSSLTNISIPDSVTSIGNSAFNGCSSLTQLTIPKSVTSIAYGAFMECKGLTELTIPGSITTISKSAFFLCSGLTSLTISDGVQTIGQNAFLSCLKLKAITIPKSVTAIDDSAFSNCSALEEIVFDGSAPTIGSNAFSYVTSTAYYYPDSTWTSNVMQNYGGTITWAKRQLPTQKVSVTIASYGAASDAVTVQLIPGGQTEATYTLSTASSPANSGTWSIEGVAPGSYTVKVTKLNHVTREYELAVSDAAAVLDVEIWLLGDVTGDGLVNFSDYSKVLSQSKNPASQVLSDYAFLCGDVAADGIINFSDYSKVLSQAKGKHTLW